MKNKLKILSICGSPRKGNSEAILYRLKEILERKGLKNEIILLREKNIQRCRGCVEYCNRNLKCYQKDDMAEIMKKNDQSPWLYLCPTKLFWYATRTVQRFYR